MPKPIKARALSMAAMREAGFLVGGTERFIHQTNTKIDLFGFIDFIAIKPGRIIAVQCCARSGLAPHRKKIAVDCREAAEAWLTVGEIQLHGWDRIEVETKAGAKSPTKTQNRLRIEVIDQNWLDKLDERNQPGLA